MTTTANMSLVLPTVGGSSGAWGPLLNAIFQILDAHTHATGSGVKITPGGIDINGDLTFAGNGATNLGKILFSAVTALASGSKALFVSSSDNELYWRTNGGTNVKLTSGNALNVAAFVGGIAGDYASTGAEVAFDDANDRYTFKQNSATGWARLASGEVRVLETGTSESVYVGLAAPAGLAASHTITLPLAVPSAASAPVHMSSSGVLTAARPARVRHIPIAAGHAIGAGVTITLDVAALGGAAASFAIPIVVDEGERITTVEGRVSDSGGGSEAVRMLVYRIDNSNSGGQTATQLGTTQSSTGSAGTLQTLTVSGLTETVGTQFYTYVAFFDIVNYSVGGTVVGLTVTTDGPS